MENEKINIAIGRSANSTKWKNTPMLWSEFADRLRAPHHTNETHKEFIASSKAEQLNIKDVGGYVGGYLRGGKRSMTTVVHRQLATLDIDFAHLEFWDDFTLMFGCAAIMHGTHKHIDASPRYRLLIPLSRECSPDEYVAVTRQIAGQLGIDLFDNTTFEPNRLMFWQSTPKDIEYYFEEQQGDWVDVDEVLNSYIDWTDTSLWPTADKRMHEIGEATKKQEDPRSKKGIVGAFCRAYSITSAIERYLSDEYVPTHDDKRYTYTKGSTAAGLMIYDDTFAFSHHGTDPCGGKLSNSFDLVRVHLFGHLDEGSKSNTKSFSAMADEALKDKAVKKIIAQDVRDQAHYDYAEDVEEVENVEGDHDDTEWMTELESDKNGKYLSTSTNINIILANDSRLKNVFSYNTFDRKKYVLRSLPWRKVKGAETLEEVDLSGVRNYIESVYGIASPQKIADSLALEFQKQSFHPIQKYLSALEWDGIKRVDTLLIDYFGADDSIYTREAIRKQLVGSVARAMNPGCKYDLMLTLVGVEGTFKSTFIKILGNGWYSDTFLTVHGTQALEQIQGVWLMEIAELSGFKKSDTEAIKHFVTKQEDTYRAAYGKVIETHKRQTTFWPTTNEKDFLTSSTGNRRFNPVEIKKGNHLKHVFTDLPKEVNQIWAEAMKMYKDKEPLFLSKEAEELARMQHRKHAVTDDRAGIIEDYLNTKLPDNWKDLDIYDRRAIIENPPSEGKAKNFVCMAEIWCECLGKAREDMSRYNTREINEIMRSLEGWEYSTTNKKFKLYGRQKYYARKPIVH